MKRFLFLSLLVAAAPAFGRSTCEHEELYRAKLPEKREECRHVWAVVQEFRERFSEITKFCREVRKVADQGAVITKKERNRLVGRIKELFNPPSFGSVEVNSMPELCLGDRDKLYEYRRDAIASFQPLIKSLDHLANDRDPLR